MPQVVPFIPLITGGATALAGIYGANKLSGAQEHGADVQAQAAKDAAETQARSAERALQYSRAQSQLALDQYNAQQVRLQPYRNLGLFAMGQPFQNAPAPLTLPPVPPDPSAPPPASTGYRPLSQVGTN